MENVKKLDLNYGWSIDIDPKNKGVELGWDKAVSETAIDAYVPSIMQQFFPQHHGVAFYWCEFTPELTVDETDKIILNFGGVDYKAQVWLNGKELGQAECPETPFNFDVTDIIKNGKKNLLSVRVINPTDETIDGLNIQNIPHRNKSLQPQAGSNLNHGGIWFGVDLTVLPGVHITDKFVSGDIHTGEINIQVEMNNTLAEDIEACVEMNIYDKNDACTKITGQVSDVLLKSGINAEGFKFIVPQHKLWSPDEPNLYRVEIILDSSVGQHRIALNFGFREFIVKDGFFYLNGKKTFLKCSHSGNAFPIGEMFPVAEGHMRKDFILAKSCGFNCVRSIAGMFRPEQLDLCDEMGLMIYEECLASWLMGVGPLDNGDHEKFLERYDNATAAMIKRDRNHASIVAWGLLNETLHDDIYDKAVKFLPIAKALDPTRLIILSSGRFDSDFRVGSASNPFVYEWENVWGTDGEHKDEYLAHNPYTDWGSLLKAGDHHHYPLAPMQKMSEDRIRNLGKDTKPIFLSEYGIGALFNVIEEWQHFVQYGCRQDLPDGAWLEYQSRALMKDWERFGLQKVYPFPEMMLKESQRLNADVRYRDFNLIRSNPNLCGFSLTGLLDHGMCGEGLWSYWRRFKPEMYDAVSDGWAPLRFCLFAKSHIYSGEKLEIEAVLANEGILKPGKYTADVAVMSERGTVKVFSNEFDIKGDEFAVPVMKETFKEYLPTGKYYIKAALRNGGSPVGTTLDFYVTEKLDVTSACEKIYCKGLKKATVELLEEQGFIVEEYNGQTEGRVILGVVDEATLKMAEKSANEGARVLFINMDAFKEAEAVKALNINDDLKSVDYRDWLYHKECVITEGTIFSGLGHGLVDFPRYGQTFPHRCFETSAVPDYVISPAFLTGYHAIKNAYGSFHVAMGFNKGKGKIFFNCFDIENNIGIEPAADILLTNFVNYIK